MNPIRFALSSLILAAGASGLLANIEFVGLVSDGDATRFGLTDTETQQTRWVKRGEAFANYAVTGYDEAAQTVILAKDGTELRVALKKEAITPPPPTPPAPNEVPAPAEYLIRPGDTGAKIARAHGITVKDLVALNPDVNWARLTVGQKVRVK